jgi:acetyl esterase/lipase
MRGCVTAAIEYRSAAKQVPAAILDCNAAVGGCGRMRRARIDPDTSGGRRVGGRAFGWPRRCRTGLKNCRRRRNAEQSSQLQAAVVLAGPFNWRPARLPSARSDPEKSNTNRWLGKTIDEAPELYQLASPFTHLSKATPPLLFLHGELDHPEQNLPSRQRLHALGVAADVLVYKSGKHGCWNQHPWFGPMVDDLDAFLTATLKRPTKPEWFPRQATDWGEIRFAASGLELRIARRPPDSAVRIPRLNNPVPVAYVAGDEAKTPLKLSPG